MHTDTAELVTLEACIAADDRDPLAHVRDQFVLPEGIIYLDGNSLGAMPRAAAVKAREVVESQWGTDLIASWNAHHWFELPVRIGEKIARLIGGQDGGCVASDTTSINLFKALGAALSVQREDQPERRVIVSERENFPTDLYMVEGMIDFLNSGYELRLIDNERSLAEALDEDVAIVLLTHVNYRTGRMWPLAEVTRLAHDAGALMIWDLCHSVGAVELDLGAARADFAVGCTYKYLNGGPGSPAFIWVAERHLARAKQPLTGWWSHARPFEMATGYEPAADARKFLSGTQPIISLSTMEVGIDLALSVDQKQLRAKSLALTSLFIRLVDERLGAYSLTLVTPREDELRGSHVSLRHPEGYAIMKALIDRGIIGDYREPEVLRFGIAPLYLSFADIWHAVDGLRQVLETESWRAAKYQQRDVVT